MLKWIVFDYIILESHLLYVSFIIPEETVSSMLLSYSLLDKRYHSF